MKPLAHRATQLCQLTSLDTRKHRSPPWESIRQHPCQFHNCASFELVKFELWDPPYELVKFELWDPPYHTKQEGRE